MRNIQCLTEKAVESQETFRNFKAEIDYLSFCMKSRGRQVKYLENMINSLSTVLDGTYTNIEEMANTTKEYRKEKEKCQQRIERLEKSLKTLQKETENR
ncbi:hypothetical protein C0J52_23485 [Blattella germanica]|nr:hypothetical protein C0J52_23485 [Blattella germanica]